ALVFYWPRLERQICVSGTVTRLPVEESDAYFQSRPRGSRIAAWASQQSTKIDDREILERRMRDAEAKYANDVPKPEYWGGYVLAPSRIEFWQGRTSRLHDRFCYERKPNGDWGIDRLSP